MVLRVWDENKGTNEPTKDWQLIFFGTSLGSRILDPYTYIPKKTAVSNQALTPSVWNDYVQWADQLISHGPSSQSCHVQQVLGVTSSVAERRETVGRMMGLGELRSMYDLRAQQVCIHIYIYIYIYIYYIEREYNVCIYIYV
jgi:hypothetical protein